VGGEAALAAGPVRATQGRPDDDVGGRLLLAFDGRRVPTWLGERLRSAPAAGVTLFRQRNVGRAAEVRALVGELQALRRGPDLIVAADQEGGQFLALGEDPTAFPGAMSLGATGDAELARRVGEATGRELRAMGVNVAYAPVCDVASNARNPALGIRAFGDDPVLVAALAGAFTKGLSAAGVAACAKHFPGLGSMATDTHHGPGRLDAALADLKARDLPPFSSAIAHGARLVMAGHAAVPAMTEDDDLPASLSRSVLTDLLRGELGFEGVVVSDALDMAALGQGAAAIVDGILALRAGVDLLLCAPDREAIERLEAGLRQAVRRGLIDPWEHARSLERIFALRAALAEAPQPSLDVVGSAEHASLAAEVAARSITLVRDEPGLLPIPRDKRILAVMPVPRDLTPADTSSMVAPGLADALLRRFERVDAIVTGHPPTETDIAVAAEQAKANDVVVVGTIAASFDPAQVRLVEALLATGRPTITVALRTPWDLEAYPAAGAHLCTYSILGPSLAALADVLAGAALPVGRLPVSTAA
jgi:beta-N-acetylhexosaminidase